jgi:hypothetical protein
MATREGYLLLADISGYTAFLTGTELEHAQAIIRELTTLIRERLAPPMRFVKLEGDAVFCYADGEVFRDGERLVELVERCYFDFSNRLRDMERATTCRCAACAAIGSLGLKFIAHFGGYVVEREGGREDLAGPDVILAHRLLKNTISESGGPEAYAFFTEACRQHLPAGFELPEHREEYDTFGEVRGGVYDLRPVLDGMRASRRLKITSADADFEIIFDLPVPPPVAWHYMVDPLERQRWACVMFSKDPDRVAPNASGRVGAGAEAHCNHGPAGTFFREILDWQPFEYFTATGSASNRLGRLIAPPLFESFEFETQEERGTRVSYRLRVTDRGRLSLLAFRALRRFLSWNWRRGRKMLFEIVDEDVAAQRAGGTADRPAL